MHLQSEIQKNRKRPKCTVCCLLLGKVKGIPSDLCFALRLPVTSMCCFARVSFCAEIVFMLEQWIFLILKFKKQQSSYRAHFSGHVDVKKGPKKYTITALFENSQRTGNF